MALIKPRRSPLSVGEARISVETGEMLLPGDAGYEETHAARIPTETPIQPRRTTVAAPPQPFVVRWRLAFLHAAPLPYGKRLKAQPDLKERSLPQGVRYVLLVLSTFMDHNGYCWPSQCAIAERTGMGERSVGAHLRHAIDNKWLRATARKAAKLRPGRPGLAYQALIPEGAEYSRAAHVPKEQHEFAHVHNDVIPEGQLLGGDL